MAIQIVFETHALSEDNAAGIATGWLPGRLSAVGREGAAALGRRRRDDGLAVVFSSDLARATETARIAFGDAGLEVLADWRLRECDYGALNGAPTAQVHDNRLAYLDEPYPGGESWRQATERVREFLDDLLPRWEGARVLLIGHVATRWGLDRVLLGADLAELASADFAWQEGWEYRLEATGTPSRGPGEYDERPWGSYTVLDDREDHKVKRIVVRPGQRLSYQRHLKRAEHWFVVSGVARVVLDEIAHDLRPGASIEIPRGSAHRVENVGRDGLVFVEIQYGDYFGEDDIIRLSDDYGRVSD